MDRVDMSLTRRVINEIAAAFGVLAIIFLSFAYQPANAGNAGIGDVYLSAIGVNQLSFCGQTPNSEHSSSWRCDACRLSASIITPKSSSLIILKVATIMIRGDFKQVRLAPNQVNDNKEYARAPPLKV